jgi:hypothetical protein
MGLLEEAIREHLELKRLRGADPGEVAREQREALDPPRREAPAASVEGQAAVVDDEANAAGEVANGVGAPVADQSAESPQPSDDGSFSHVGQETAELDMQAVLEDEAGSAEPDARPDQDAPSPAPTEEDSLEWEVPPRGARNADQQPDQRVPEDGDGPPV